MRENGSKFRTSSWSIATDDDAATWDRWLSLLEAARHPALARVVEGRQEAGSAFLTVLDDDSEAVTDWARRTDASVPERLAVLRAAAAALDSLHDGTAVAAGLPHGGVSTTAVRVTPDRSTRLVGYTPWAGTAPGSERFLPPELGTGDAATTAGDVYAFARTVAEVLGGPGVEQAGDANDVARALRSNADTRRRTRLVRAIHTAMTSPPDARPQPLTAWLSRAVEGTAATEVAGVTPPVDAEQTSDTEAPSARFGWKVAIAVLVVLAGLAGWGVRSHTGTPRSALPPASPTPAVKAGPITVHPAWASPCGPDTGIASDTTADALREPTTVEALDGEPEGMRIGRWHSGRLLLELVGRSDDDPIVVTGVGIKRAGAPRPATWVVRPEPCVNRSGATPALGYRVDLDHWRVRLVDPGSRDSVTAGRFYLRTTPVVIALDVSACDGSFGWQPVVRYLSGSRTREFTVNRIFYTYGRSRDASLYTLGDRKAMARMELGAAPSAGICGPAD